MAWEWTMSTLHELFRTFWTTRIFFSSFPLGCHLTMMVNLTPPIANSDPSHTLTLVLLLKAHQNWEHTFLGSIFFCFVFKLNLMKSDSKRVKHTQRFLSNNCVKVALRETISSCLRSGTAKWRCVYRISMRLTHCLSPHTHTRARSSYYNTMLWHFAK